MWANDHTTAPERTPENRDDTRSNHEDPGALEAAHRRSILARARANAAPVFNDGQSSIGRVQNPEVEQHESLGNVATECQIAPRKRHVAEI